MKYKLFLLLMVLFPPIMKGQNIKANAQSKFALVIHGGAGDPGKLTPEKEHAYKQSLKTALAIGYNVLIRGGTAVDAVEKVVIYLEDDSLFNAGGRTSEDAEGRSELDAAIMDGSNAKIGVVKDVVALKNPVCAARAVMDKLKTDQVVLSGHIAEEFAARQGLPVIDTRRVPAQSQKDRTAKARPIEKNGTVGAVALDMYGHLAAATSTAGMAFEGGDSRQMGGAAYAEDSICATSFFASGEYYARLVMLNFVPEEMKQKHRSLQDATTEMIDNKLTAVGIDGGLIGVDRQGNIIMPFNTPSMLRGYIKSGGEPWVAIYK